MSTALALRLHRAGVAWLRSRGWTPMPPDPDGIVRRVVDVFGGSPIRIQDARAEQRHRDALEQRKRIGCLCGARAGHLNPACPFSEQGKRRAACKRGAKGNDGPGGSAA